MMKIRLNLTIEDYYDYVGTNPHYPKKKRVRSSLPSQLQDGYNMKFKEVSVGWSSHKWYRVHISVNISQENLDRMISYNASIMHSFQNLSYKIIKEECPQS